MTTDLTTIITSEGSRPCTRTQAARELARQDSARVEITFTDTDGDTHNFVTVHGRHRAYGEMQPAHVSWASTCAQFGAEDTRKFAEAITVAAEIASLADEIAAEAETAAPA